MDLRKKVFTGIFYNLSGNLVITLSLFVSNIIIARTLGPSQYGAYMLFLAISIFILAYSDLGVNQGFKRYIPEIIAKRQTNLISKIFIEGMRVHIAVLAVGIIGLWIFQGEITHIFKLNPYLTKLTLLLISFYILFSALLNPLNTMLISFYRQKSLNLIGAFFTTVFALAIYTAFTLDLLTINLVLTLLLLRVTVMVIGYFIKFRQISKKDGTINEEFFRDIKSRFWRHNKLMFLMGFGTFLVTYRSGDYFLGYFIGLQAVAFYSIAIGFAETAFSIIMPRNLTLLFDAATIHQYKEHGLTELQKMFRYFIKFFTMLALPIGIGGAILSKDIILLLYGEEYAPAAPLLGIFFLILPTLKFGTIFLTIINVFEKQKILVYTSMFGLLNIILNVLLIPLVGIWGALIAITITTWLTLSIHYFYSYKFAKIKFPFKPIGRYLLSSLVMGAVVYSITLKFEYALAIKLFFSVAIGAVTYFAMLVLVQALEKEDVVLLKRLDLPILNRVLRFYESKKLF